jgi:replication factor A1
MVLKSAPPPKTTKKAPQETDNVKPLIDVSVGETVTVLCRFLEVERREVQTKKGRKNILRGVAADTTTKLPFVSWVEHSEIAAGKTAKIENAFVGVFQGIQTININENTAVTRSNATLPPVEELSAPEISKIKGLDKRKGILDVVVEGDILSIGNGSGAVVRCPACRRVVQKNFCRVHGAVDAVADSRIKMILDDGTGALLATLNGELTRRIVGDALKEDEIKKRLIGIPVRMRGKVLADDSGKLFVAKEIELIVAGNYAKPINTLSEKLDFSESQCKPTQAPALNSGRDGQAPG